MSAPTLRELLAKATPGPYFVDHHKGTAEDFEAHAKSGLATVDTGRAGDWPIAYFCEWPQAQLIARCSPDVMAAVLEALERIAWSRKPINSDDHVTNARRALALLNGNNEQEKQ